MNDVAVVNPVFKAVADPTRRQILDILARGEQAALALAKRFAVSQPAISQHLKILREANLVSARKNGRQRLYRLNAGPLRAVYDWAGHYEAFWGRKLDALERYLEGLS